MQRRFVMKVLAGAKKMGVHSAIETNGFLGAELTDALEHTEPPSAQAVDQACQLLRAQGLKAT